ncbi:acyl-CoA dehydrogenase [uncultured Massilia sp.]|uniref:acyl-CoA dehydrogenase n=1 Tax=uncultured Massilia sp. TaxID=169973 RepID=UPI0025D4AF18|nr:acyl-CoA dehydrogenase [uncultured Massilia sp.]
MPPFSRRDAERIARHAPAADAARWLHPVQQALIHRRGWLRMLAPRALGGDELPLPQVVRLEEAIARVDGSMAWTVTLCAGAGWFTGFLDPSLAREILATPRACLAGSGAPTGVAERDGDGWRIDGQWDYASGAPMATHFTFNALLRADGKPLLDALGQPRIQAFVVPAALVEIVPNWRTLGLRATASHAYQVAGRRVHARHGFTIDPDAARAQGPLYRFPFMAFAFVTLAANVAGMGAHFVELARAAIGQRRHRFGNGEALIDVPAVRAALDGAEAALEAARGRVYALLDATWERVDAGARVDEAQAAELQALAMAWVGAARHAVDTLYPYCGLQAAREDSDINRVWRDFHTGAQHALLTPLDPLS